MKRKSDNSDHINRRILLDQLQKEQELYREDLLSQSPEEILKHAYEYCVRENIAASLKYLDISEEEAKLLLPKRGLLEELYENYEMMETDHMDTIIVCLKKLLMYSRESKFTAPPMILSTQAVVR